MIATVGLMTVALGRTRASNCAKLIGSNPVVATNRAVSVLFAFPRTSHSGLRRGESRSKMKLIKATQYSNNNLVVPDADIDLTVTNQDEFKGLVETARNALRKRADVFSTASSTLSDRKRTALYEDLGAAGAVAKVLLDPANGDYLIDILDELDIPMVLDPTKRNEYVPICRLLWGYMPKVTTANPNPEFTWSRSTELYAKVLRGATLLGVQPADLAARLKKDKGFKSFKDADNRKYLKTDEDEKAKNDRRKLVINDEPKGHVPVGQFDFSEVEKEEGHLVSLLGVVREDGSVDIVQRLAATQTGLSASIDKMDASVIADIRTRKAVREAEEAKREAEEAKREANALREQLTEAAKAASEKVFSDVADQQDVA